MFLVETWLKKARLTQLRDKLKFDGMIEFSRERRGGRVEGWRFFGRKNGFLGGHIFPESY